MSDTNTFVSDYFDRAMSQGYLYLDETDLPKTFFMLRSGLAGELFQKFMNYQLPLAIVVKDPTAYGDRFTELAREHRTHPRIRFFVDHPSAEVWLNTQT